MSSISIKHSGSLKNIEGWFHRDRKKRLYKLLNDYGQRGVELLRDATPVDTGRTAAGWKYEIAVGARGVSLYWTNDNVNDGVPIALVIQYGHATRSGGYVEGIDYINPALAPIFKKMADTLWKEVS